MCGYRHTVDSPQSSSNFSNFFKLLKLLQSSSNFFKLLKLLQNSSNFSNFFNFLLTCSPDPGRPVSPTCIKSGPHAIGGSASAAAKPRHFEDLSDLRVSDLRPVSCTQTFPHPLGYVKDAGHHVAREINDANRIGGLDVSHLVRGVWESTLAVLA
jgi:hypothetical protein